MILKKTILTGFLLIFFQFGFSKINPTELVVNNQVSDTTSFSFSPVKVNIFLSINVYLFTILIILYDMISYVNTF